MYGKKEAKQLMNTTNCYFEFLFSNVKADEHKKPNLLSFVHLFPSYGSEQLSWLKRVLLPIFIKTSTRKELGHMLTFTPQVLPQGGTSNNTFHFSVILDYSIEAFI